MTEDDFSGWSLEGWSLQHELLELRFNYWPVFTTDSDIELYDRENQNTYYRGKGIFTRPTRMAFTNFTAPAKVETVNAFKREDGTLTYRFALEGDAYVEIEARAYVSARW
ncbi:hypothetical protein [Taklimakanibacter albus]|uniref:Uncharacterized protein n=1 Tax=Taklimakanibacter albus TaxID=2800327 RepID=A0ACC5RBV6_9HYPH|nr:hypothetical protein [Aestuariivirga sp. YIM B02566]MBK1869950.1 hypothetical protein [Aestuariivirga sp. YIM B02566]